MNRRTIGIILLLLGVGLVIGAGALGVLGLRSTMDSFKPTATLAAPGQLEIELPAGDTYSLWHDHVTFHDGRSVRHPQALPHGYGFSLENLDRPIPVPFTPASGNMTMNVNNRQSVLVGSFEVAVPGSYRLTASQPDGEERIFSLTQGTFGRTFGAIGRVFLAGLLAFLGLALGVTGLLLVLLGRRKPQPPAVPAA